MTTGFLILTVLFIIVSAIMILIILVQRPQGGGLAGAFGGAGGGSTDTVFGGRVGDALTFMTVCAFAAYVLLAVGLNIMDPSPSAQPVANATAASQPADGTATPPVTPTTAPGSIDGATPPVNDTVIPPATDGTTNPPVQPVDGADPTGARPNPNVAPTDDTPATPPATPPATAPVTIPGGN